MVRSLQMWMFLLADHLNGYREAPVSTFFALIRISQSLTRPGLSSGFGTAMPLEQTSTFASVDVAVIVGVAA